MTREEISGQAFPQAFRGLSEAAVRSFLRRVADDYEALRVRQEGLQAEVDDLEARLAEQPRSSSADPLTALGEETARVLRSAQESADDIRRAAQERADALLREAQEEARRLRDDTEAAVGERTRHAEEASDAMLREAERLARELQEGAEARVAEFETQAQTDIREEVDAARRRAKELMAEAEVSRDRMVRELTRRKETLEAQLDVLRTGRDRLVEAYRVVKRTLDEATEALRTTDARGPGEAPRSRVAAPARPAPPVTEGEKTAAGGDAAMGDETAELEALAEPERGPDTEDHSPEADSAGAGESQVEPEDGETAAPRVGSFTLGELPPAAEPAERAEPDAPAPGDDASWRGPARPLDPAERRDPAPPVRLLGAEHGPAPEAEPERDPAPEAEDDVAGAPAADDVEAIFAKLRASTEPDDATEAEHDALREPAVEGTGEGEERQGDSEPSLSASAPPSAETRLIERRDSVLTQHSAELVKMLKRVLRDEQNVVLEGLRRHRGIPAADDVLPSADEQDRAVGQAAGAILADAWSAGAAAARELGASPTSNGDGSATRARTLAAGLAHDLLEPLRTRLAEALGEAAATEDSEAGERVRARYREWKGQRVEDAARQALGAAFVQGVYDAFPEGAPLRWVAGDPSPCTDCADNGLEVTARGSAFPTGHRLPPAHGGCRCVLAPVQAGVSATG